MRASNDRVERHLAGIERHRQGQRLEGRAHLVDAGGQAVDAGRIVGLARIVGVVVRHRHHGDDLAGVDVEDEAGRGLGLVLLARRDQFVAQRVLDAQIDRELDRLLLPVGGEAGQVQVGEPVPVEPFLDAGDALVVDVDVADDVRDLGAVRIDALVLGQEADAGNAEAWISCCCFGVISRLSQTKPLARAEPLAQLGRRRDRAAPRSAVRPPRRRR